MKHTQDGQADGEGDWKPVLKLSRKIARLQTITTRMTTMA